MGNEDFDSVENQRADAMECHPYITKRVEEMAEQVNEIHSFIKGIGEALNNPMLKSMLPPNMRNLV